MAKLATAAPVAPKKPTLAKAAPAAPAKPAPKAKPAPAAAATPKVERAPRTDYEGKRIHILVDGNPKREGTASYERFALYKKNMLVTEAIAAGVRRADLDWDQKHGYIEIK